MQLVQSKIKKYIMGCTVHYKLTLQPQNYIFMFQMIYCVVKGYKQVAIGKSRVALSNKSIN